MHPLTPLISSWQVLVVVLVAFGHQFVAVLADPAAAISAARDGVSQLSGDSRSLVLAAAAGLAVVGLVAGWMGLSWWATRYRVTPEALELHRGVLSRSQRRARLDRLQAVDVVQPVLARIVGLSKLTLDVAGGGRSRIELAYLPEERARQLRAHLLAAAAGVHFTPGQAPDAPEAAVLEVPPDRLVASVLLSAETVTTLALLAGAGAIVAGTGETAALGAFVPGLITLITVVWQGFSKNFGFRVAASPDGVRLRRGLLEQRSQTVPPGRVQAVRISQPLLWRARGWWRLQINVAGYELGGNRNARVIQESTLLPVGPVSEVLAVLALVLPEPGLAADERPGEALAEMLTAARPPAGFLSCPRRAVWLDPLGQARNGIRLTDTMVVLRGGRLRRRVDLVPQARVQSCSLHQGPLRRRLGLAGVSLHSTPGVVRPRLAHLDADDARLVFADLVERGRRARAGAPAERWMKIGEPDGE